MTDLPRKYRVLPHVIPLEIPNFPPGGVTFAPSPLSCAARLDAFVARVREARDRPTYLPVCRMSDGEFLFALGDQPPVRWHPQYPRELLRYAKRLVSRRRGFSIEIPGVCHAGRYDHGELARLRSVYPELVREIAHDGILAVHLSYGPRPFQEQFFPALRRWIHTHSIPLTDESFVPFYLVYAALRGPRRAEILAGARVLMVTSALEDKAARIEDSLRAEGVREIAWARISPNRSFYDVIDVAPLRGRVDLVLVGAGVGKPQLFRQLRSLGVPCLDVGFLVEIWADPARAKERPFCLPS